MARFKLCIICSVPHAFHKFTSVSHNEIIPQSDRFFIKAAAFSAPFRQSALTRRQAAAEIPQFGTFRLLKLHLSS
jgi:hypothetical protein